MTKFIKVELKFTAILNQSNTNAPSSLVHEWNELLLVTTFLKFGKSSSPNFPALSVPSYSYMDSFNPNLVTRTATSYTALLRMNFNLQSLSILNPEFVEDLFIFADVIEVYPQSVVSIPGKKNVYIICRKFISHSYSNKVPKLIADSNGFTIVANDFYWCS